MAWPVAMSTISKRNLFALAALSALLAAATGQTASTGWAQNHPRRAEINARLTVQNWRINQAEDHCRQLFKLSGFGSTSFVRFGLRGRGRFGSGGRPGAVFSIRLMVVRHPCASW
jgi:hypothetical protein